MKRNIVWRAGFFVTLMLSLAAVAQAQDPPGWFFESPRAGACSPAMVAGTWGYTETGTLYLSPDTPIPYASVGQYTLDAHGNLSGRRTASAGGNIMKATIKGTATVNRDCTGTETLNFYDELGNLTGTAVKSLVYVDNGREAHKIIISAARPAVLTTIAKKLFREWDDFRR